ncbi:hypothetical protein BFL38_08185 [Brachyspira hampsonii]|uniref:Uncharacterized protein n=1 Tax=Brachyspira hampsonii TaxID=1287055 RepID=A0A1E5NF93_9SPIR|nr:hypothetical protein [Brachyspira hampsonii]OEJ14806.1 hypothetical protein BFL38_08185 [Brachyspira hampsonii]
MENLIIYKPKNKEELKKLTDDENINLYNVDTSLIKDMTALAGIFICVGEHSNNKASRSR